VSPKTPSSRLRQFVPPAARRLANQLLGAWTTYRGPYVDWATARAASNGYDDAKILSRVVDATRQVLSGEADYEQDGVAMHGVPPPSDALAALLMAAAMDCGNLSVLDFGGGLGSHYVRWRRWLSPLAGMHWCVVEQPHFVAAGTTLFSDRSSVSFASSIEQAKANSPNAVIASSVLQYLQDPIATLDALVAVDARVIVIDRTPISAGPEPIVLVQHVPKSLGRASYPLWLLPREVVHARLRGRYSMLLEFTSDDEPLRAGRIRGDFMGSVWLRGA
jgi:putative methyltransferase (TIGR04325 family)